MERTKRIRANGAHQLRQLCDQLVGNRRHRVRYRERFGAYMPVTPWDGVVSGSPSTEIERMFATLSDAEINCRIGLMENEINRGLTSLLAEIDTLRFNSKEAVDKAPTWALEAASTRLIELMYKHAAAEQERQAKIDAGRCPGCNTVEGSDCEVTCPDKRRRAEGAAAIEGTAAI
jgi:uncharacterized small protein (DUF1192 family)